MIAVIRTCGKQYEVKEKQVLKLDAKLGEVGATLEFPEVLLVADEAGKDVKLGAPLVDGAKVTAKVLAHGRARKVIMIKYKRKTRQQRRRGHRQDFTKVMIEKI